MRIKINEVILSILIIVSLLCFLGTIVGCKKNVVWNDQAQRCQQMEEPYQFVSSAKCGR